MVSNVKDYGNVYSVYIHTCPNGKKYVGMTRQIPSVRWHGGKGYKNQKEFFQAIEAFGWSNIKHEIVVEGVDIDTASKLERELIERYDTRNRQYGYNTKNGGETFGEHSEEFLINLQARMKGNTYSVGRKISKEHIEALIAGRTIESYKREKGVFHHSESTKQLISNKAKERWSDEGYRKRARENHRDNTGSNNPMFGKKHSPETRQKIAEKAYGRKASDETRLKMSKSARKRRVAKYDLYGNLLEKFDSCKDASVSVGGNSTNISFACRNPERTYKGYRWGYIDDNT